MGSTYRRLIGNAGPIHAIAIGRLGSQDVVLTAAGDGTICAWDRRGNHAFTIDASATGTTRVLGVVELEGHDFFVTGADDATVRLWDRHGESVGEPFSGHTGRVTAVAKASFEGADAILSATPHGEIILWNPEGRVLRKHALTSPLVEFGPADRAQAVVGVGHFTLAVFSPMDGQLYSVQVPKVAKTALAAGQIGAGEVIPVGFDDGTIHVLRLDGTEALRPIRPVLGPATALALGKIDGKDTLVSLGRSSRISVWDHRGNLVSEPWAGRPGTAKVVATGTLQGRSVLACGGEDGVVRIWEDHAIVSRTHTSSRDTVTSLAVDFVDGEAHVLTATASGAAFWSGSGQQIALPGELRGKSARHVYLAGGPLSPTIVVVGHDDTVHVWRNESVTTFSLRPETGIVCSAVSFDDGRVEVAVALRNGNVELYGESGEHLLSISVGGKRPVSRMVFGSLGRTRVLAITNGQVLRLFRLDTHRWLAMPRIPPWVSPPSRCSETAISTSWSSAGRTAACGSGSRACPPTTSCRRATRAASPTSLWPWRTAGLWW